MTTALLPRDFVHSTIAREWVENRFSDGTLRHVVTALNGNRALFVIEGLTYEGTARYLRQTPGYGTYQLVIETTLSDGTTQRTAFSTSKFQVIIPLEDELGTKATRWVAADLIREEERRAFDIAVARHEPVTTGRITTECWAAGVWVRWEPSSLASSSRGWLETIRRSELESVSV